MDYFPSTLILIVGQQATLLSHLVPWVIGINTIFSNGILCDMIIANFWIYSYDLDFVEF